MMHVHTATSCIYVCDIDEIGLDPLANSQGLLTTTPAVKSLPDGHVNPLG